MLKKLLFTAPSPSSFSTSPTETGGPREALLSAIDDYVEAITGDRNGLHERHGSIG